MHSRGRKSGGHLWSELPPWEAKIMQRHFPPFSSQGKRFWTAVSTSHPSSAPPPSAACRQPNTFWKVSASSVSCSGLVSEGRGSRVQARAGREPANGHESHQAATDWPSECWPQAQPLHVSRMPGRNCVWGPVTTLSFGGFCRGFRKPGSWGVLWSF